MILLVCLLCLIKGKDFVEVSLRTGISKILGSSPAFKQLGNWLPSSYSDSVVFVLSFDLFLLALPSRTLKGSSPKKPGGNLSKFIPMIAEPVPEALDLLEILLLVDIRWWWWFYSYWILFYYLSKFFSEVRSELEVLVVVMSPAEPFLTP